MRLKQVSFAVASVVVLALVAGIAWWRQSAAEKKAPPRFPVVPAVDVSVPGSKLLQDALHIMAYRKAGSLNFSLLPKTRPPDLLRMSTGWQEKEPIFDQYQFGEQKLFTMITLSSAPHDACKSFAREVADSMCVRDGVLGTASPGNEQFRYLTVRLSGNVSTAPKDGDPETERAKKFWVVAEMVPLDQAVWFTDLVTQAEAAVVK